jgi:hypothetical protein
VKGQTVDRQHYTVSPTAGCTNPPSSCPLETSADEQRATELGPSGIEVMPADVRARIAALWETADAVAKANDFNSSRRRSTAPGSGGFTY